MKLKVALNELLIYNKNFVFRKLEFNMICYAYLNESPFKYFISLGDALTTATVWPFFVCDQLDLIIIL